MGSFVPYSQIKTPIAVFAGENSYSEWEKYMRAAGYSDFMIQKMRKKISEGGEK